MIVILEIKLKILYSIMIEAVERGDYKEGISDKERLILLRDFCSKLATDINATYGEIDKAERLFSRVSDSFRELVRP